MTCSNVIFDCKKSKGIEPEAFSSSVDNSNSKASNALITSTNNRFASSYNQRKLQLWSVDFKHPVAIKIIFAHE